jgi:hypothetical protein
MLMSGSGRAKRQAAIAFATPADPTFRSADVHSQGIIWHGLQVVV